MARQNRRGLARGGHAASRNRVERLTRHHGIRAITPRWFRVCTTDSHHDLPARPEICRRPPPSGMARRHNLRANRRRMALSGRRARSLHQEDRRLGDARSHAGRLTIAAVTMAIQRQKPPPGLIHRSDRGSQYASAGYRKVLGAAGMSQSMSRKGNCWDPRTDGKLLRHSENRTRATGLLPNPGCRSARLVRHHRTILHFAYPVRCQSRSRVRPVAAVEFFIRGG